MIKSNLHSIVNGLLLLSRQNPDWKDNSQQYLFSDGRFFNLGFYF